MSRYHSRGKAALLLFLLKHVCKFLYVNMAAYMLLKLRVYENPSTARLMRAFSQHLSIACGLFEETGERPMLWFNNLRRLSEASEQRREDLLVGPGTHMPFSSYAFPLQASKPDAPNRRTILQGFFFWCQDLLYSFDRHVRKHKLAQKDPSLAADIKRTCRSNW